MSIALRQLNVPRLYSTAAFKACHAFLILICVPYPLDPGKTHFTQHLYSIDAWIFEKGKRWMHLE
jgi:hypothetical protein